MQASNCEVKNTLSFSTMFKKFIACCGLGIAVFEVAIVVALNGVN